MTEKPSDAVERLFEAVCDLEPDERSKYLDDHCANTPALRAEVELLLEYDRRQSDFLTRPAGPTGSDQGLPQRIGERVGDYKILQLLGTGGFGDVYLAEQEEPVNRRVALKLIKPGMDTRQVLARFQAERQALARMDHPGIAKILDAGATGEGRPYFAMEYVRGISITDYCDQNQLAIRERLALFVDVCRAVQHAHHKGIIHRDIKPANVLITMRDGKPAPVVIDFGIAKAIDRPLTDHTHVTHLGQFIGTPEYISPEQAHVSGLDIDTRSDVYSLGVILYQLLSGTTPFDHTGLQSVGVDEVRRILREVDPLKPSTRTSRLGGELETVASARRSEPRSLVRALHGDLDCIVMKCLEKDRTRRYESPSALADDLQRHMRHEPVLAGPPTWRYRFVKLARRNRLLFSTATLASAALIAGVTLATVGLLEARRERDHAREQETKALAIRDFFVNRMLQAASPSRGPGPDTPVRKVMEIAAAEVEQSFADDPALRASIHVMLAQTYGVLGMHRESETHADLALAAVDSGQLGWSDRVAAQAWKGDALRQLGKLDEAERWCQQAARDAARELPEESEARQMSELGLGLILWRRGKYDEALAVLDSQVELRRRLFGDRSRETLTARNVLGMTLRGVGRHTEAVALYRQLIEDADHVVGPDDPLRLRLINNLAVALGHLNEHEESMELLEQVWRAYSRVLGPTHDHTLGTMGNLARGYFLRGEYDRAEALARETIAQLLTSLDPDHHLVLRTRVELAEACVRQGRVEEGLGILREVLPVQRRVLGDHADVLFSLRKLGDTLLGQNDWTAAAEAHREGLAMSLRAFGPDSVSARSAERGLAAALQGAQQVAELREFRSEQFARLRAIVAAPDASPSALIAFAELCLESEVEEHQDVAQALDTATRLVALSDRKNTDHLALLARAQHRSSLIEAALATIEAAVEVEVHSQPSRGPGEAMLARIQELEVDPRSTEAVRQRLAALRERLDLLPDRDVAK